jgi:hypothetical protein
MHDLVLGDFVKVNNDTYEPIYSFGHKKSDASATFLEILTDNDERHPPLEISHDHMVVTEGNHVVPACVIKVGDSLLAASGKLVAVTRIRKVVRIGIYAPFTTSGFVVVNGIRVSNYISYQESEYLSIWGFETPFTYQWLAHSFNSAHRMAVMAGFAKETYTPSGISHWVALPHTVVSWLLEQPKVIAVSLLMPMISILVVISVVETFVKEPVTQVIAGILRIFVIATKEVA